MSSVGCWVSVLLSGGNVHWLSPVLQNVASWGRKVSENVVRKVEQRALGAALSNSQAGWNVRTETPAAVTVATKQAAAVGRKYIAEVVTMMVQESVVMTQMEMLAVTTKTKMLAVATKVKMLAVMTNLNIFKMSAVVTKMEMSAVMTKVKIFKMSAVMTKMEMSAVMTKVEMSAVVTKMRMSAVMTKIKISAVMTKMEMLTVVTNQFAAALINQTAVVTTLTNQVAATLTKIFILTAVIITLAVERGCLAVAATRQITPKGKEQSSSAESQTWRLVLAMSWLLSPLERNQWPTSPPLSVPRTDLAPVPWTLRCASTT